MCGIVAYSGHHNYNIDKIKFLFLSNESRGKDSCGMYSNHPGYGIIKVEGEVSKKLLPIVEIPTGSTFIGHTRQATVGLKTKENAHPFRFDEIVGVHNGKISNWLTVIKDFDIKSADINVDSQSIFACLQKANDPGDVIKNLEGEMAIVWTNTNNNNTIYCYRNSDRPLFRGKIGSDMYISSLDDSLKSIGCSKIEEFKPEYLYEITQGEITKTRYIPHKKKPVVNYNSCYRNKHVWGRHYSEAYTEPPFEPDEHPIVGKNKNLQIALPNKNIPNRSREQRDIISELKNIYLKNAPSRERYIQQGVTGNDLRPNPSPNSNKLSELFPDAEMRIIKTTVVVEENNNAEYKAALEADKLGVIPFLEGVINDLENYDYAKSNVIQTLNHSKKMISKFEAFKEDVIKKLTPVI